jgi:Flp pilus assembly protein CpaB
MTVAATIVIALIILGHDSDPGGPSVPASDTVVAQQSIAPSKRAFSFNVDALTAIGSKGPIVPGDRLDVVVERVEGAITVVEDVEVLAVGSTLNRDPVMAPESQSADIVTILGDPEQVRLLAETAGMDANTRLLLVERPDSH